MHTNVILTNKRCTHTQSNYTNTKLSLVSVPLMPSEQETEWTYSTATDPHEGMGGDRGSIQDKGNIR